LKLEWGWAKAENASEFVDVRLLAATLSYMFWSMYLMGLYDRFVLWLKHVSMQVTSVSLNAVYNSTKRP